MTNIIFREVSPECQEIDYLYDNDGIKEISGKNNALYIIVPDGYRNYYPVNGEEYKNILKQAENIADDFNALMGNDHYYFRNFKECLKYYGIEYTTTKTAKLKEWAKKYQFDYETIDAITEFLTLTTGEEWDNIGITGYCQGDYAIGIYCKGHYDNDALKLYVGAAAGTVSEFCRIEENDTCYGFFVPDSVKWNTDELRTYLSNCYGDKEEDITIELFKGYSSVATYETV